MKSFLSLLPPLVLFGALAVFSSEAAEGARQGLALCANTLAPSLFPFFVLSRLLSSMGLTDLISRWAGPLMQRLFRVSGAGAEAFAIGLSGGYPLGAVTVAALRRDGHIEKDEAERLLAFCNNSGPAFILGGVGAVFQSVKAGALLYLAHILSAFCTGLLFRGQPRSPARRSAPPAPLSFSQAFPAAVAGALSATLSVCSFVCFFSSVLALGGGFAFLPELWRIPVTGFFELGSGVASLRGFPPTPPFMAMAGFMLGWGGVSVHFQTLGAVAGTDIKCARHLMGRALCGGISAVFSYCLAYLI